MPTVQLRRRPRPSIRAIVADSEAPLSSRDFAHFLYLFRAAYARCLKLDLPAEQLLPDIAWLRDTFSSSLSHYSSPRQVAALFNADLEEDELEFPTISKASPLEFVCYGIVPALTAAAILSGGKIDLKFMKITLPPLGVGIRSLREALRLPPAKPPKKRKSK